MAADAKEAPVKEEQKVQKTEPAKVVVAPIGLRTSGEIKLRVCQSNSRPNQPAVYKGARTSIGMPVDEKTRYWNFNGQTPADIAERYPQLSKQMLIRIPQGNGLPDRLLINDEFFHNNWNLIIPDHGLTLNLAIERERFWASILAVCPQIGKKVQAANGDEKFHIVDVESEADAKVGKGKLKHDAGVILYELDAQTVERLAVLYGVNPVGSTKNEQFAALQQGIEDDPAKFLQYRKNSELTEVLIDVKLFVTNYMISIGESNDYTLEKKFLGTSEKEVALYFMKPEHQPVYLNLKMALKNKLLAQS